MTTWWSINQSGWPLFRFSLNVVHYCICIYRKLCSFFTILINYWRILEEDPVEVKSNCAVLQPEWSQCETDDGTEPFRTKTEPSPGKKRLWIARRVIRRRPLPARGCLSPCAGSAARPQQNTTSNRPFPLLISSFPDRSERARGVKTEAGKWFLAAEGLSPELLLSDLQICFCLK